jgi:NAD(P)-dependent dehydrogenase (short-subunit alcohol dehydrogenase family)
MMASITLPPNRDSTPKIFFKTQFCTKPQRPPPSTSLEGQTAVVTGSNIGIGLECVRVLLELKLSHVILAVRSIEKGEKAAETLRSSFTKAKIDVWDLDMLSYSSIQSFAARCASLGSLDLAVLNAGAIRGDFKINPSTGHEEVFQVNYLSTALLGILLLPLLRRRDGRKSPGRLTIISSSMGLTSEFPNRDATPLIKSFDDPKGWSVSAASDRYATTKTLGIMFAFNLSKFVSADDVIINTVDPGFVAGTQLHRDAPSFVRGIFAFVKALTARSLEQGAWTYVDAVAVKGRESHGSFVMNWTISP